MASMTSGVPLDSQRRVVLVADDEEAILTLMAHVIAGLGLVPLKVSDGQAALAWGSRYHQLLVCAILDVQMPIMNGAEAAQGIQRIAPDLPIVLMSGGFHPSLADRISQIRLFATLTKPFSLSTMRDVLMEIMAGSLLPRSAREQPDPAAHEMIAGLRGEGDGDFALEVSAAHHPVANRSLGETATPGPETRAPTPCEVPE